MTATARTAGAPDPDPLRRLAATPAVRWFAAAALGIATANAAPDVPAAWWFALAAAAACAGLLQARRRPMATLAAIALLGGGWFALRAGPAGPNDARLLLPAEAPTLARITAVADATPRLGTRQSGMLADAARFNPTVTRVTAAIRTIDIGEGERPARGKLWVRVDGDATARLAPGDTFTTLARVRALSPPKNPGEDDIRAYAHPRGIVGTAAVAAPDAIETLRAARAVERPLAALRARAAAAIRRLDPAPARDLLSALLLGDRATPGYDALREPFARTGLGHLLAISGLHVGIACGLAAGTLRLTGNRPRLEAAAAIAAALVILALVPARPPVVRAATIVIAFAGARLAGRRYDALQLLALAALALLVAQPAELLSAGFQLTFAVTGALVLIATPLADRLSNIFRSRTRPQRPHAALARPAAGIVAVAVVAWLASAPFTAVHFHNAPLLSVPLSIVTLPLVAAIIGLGYPALALDALLHATPLAPIAAGVAAAAIAAAELLASLVHAADSLRGSELRLPRIHPALAAGWAALGLLAARPLAADARARLDRPRPRLPRHTTPTLAITLVALTAAHLLNAGRLEPRTALRLDALAVGDGNAYIVRTPTDTLLVDAGSTWLGAGERLLPDAAAALGVRTARRAIVTHADLDHFAAIPDAARELGVRELITTPQLLRAAAQRPRSAVARFVELARQQGIRITPISAGDTIDLGRTTARALHPPADARFDRDNAASLVLSLETPGLPTLLLTADAEGPALNAIAAHDFPDRPIVADAPHHGSANGDAVATLTALDPAAVVQSTGPRRADNDAWQRLRQQTEWLTTATDGHIAITIRADGTVETAAFNDRRPNATTD